MNLKNLRGYLCLIALSNPLFANIWFHTLPVGTEIFQNHQVSRQDFGLPVYEKKNYFHDDWKTIEWAKPSAKGRTLLSESYDERWFWERKLANFNWVEYQELSDKFEKTILSTAELRRYLELRFELYQYQDLPYFEDFIMEKIEESRQTSIQRIRSDSFAALLIHCPSGTLCDSSQEPNTPEGSCAGNNLILIPNYNETMSRVKREQVHSSRAKIALLWPDPLESKAVSSSISEDGFIQPSSALEACVDVGTQTRNAVLLVEKASQTQPETPRKSTDCWCQ